MFLIMFLLGINAHWASEIKKGGKPFILLETNFEITKILQQAIGLKWEIPVDLSILSTSVINVWFKPFGIPAVA